MPHSLRDLRSKEFVYLLLILVCIAGSLFMIFTFLATAEFGEATGVALFLVVAGLLIGGYVVGLMILALVGLTALTKRLGKPSEKGTVKPPA